MHSPAPSVYFFDLPVADIPGSICDALRYMYHGGVGGAFGHRSKEPVDLDEVKAIKARIVHRSAAPLSDKFEYNLVFYSHELAHTIWSPSCRKKMSQLRTLSRRVQFNPQPSLVTRRQLDNLFIRSKREVYFARYEGPNWPDHCVPVPYHEQLCRTFVPYIMRTSIGYPLVRSLFQAQNLELHERRIVTDSPVQTNQVITYTIKNRG